MLDRATVPPSAAYWRKSAMWLVLSRSLPISAGAPLLLATLGAIASAAGWNFAGQVFLSDEARSAAPVARIVTQLERWPGSRKPDTPPPYSPAGLTPTDWGTPPADPVSAMPATVMAPLIALSSPQVPWSGIVYLVTGLLWSLLVWAFFGAAISRLAVLRFTWDHKPEFGTLLGFAKRKVGQHLAAALIPLLGVIAIGVPVVLLGAVMRWSVGAALGGVIWGGVLWLTLFNAVLALGLLVGWPLMWGALAAEDSDAFDAMSRAYAYAYQAWPRYAAYALMSAAVGLVGWLLIWGFSESIIRLTASFASVGAGTERLAELMQASDVPTSSNLDRFAGGGIRFWNGILRSIASGYGFAFFWTAFAGIYLLLRYDVEATPFDSVAEDVDGPAAQPGLVKSP